jgi:hypothetical protein
MFDADKEREHREHIGEMIRTNEGDDFHVMCAAITALVIASQIVGGMTPEEIGDAAAIALVNEGGFHRRQYC